MPKTEDTRLGPRFRSAEQVAALPEWARQFYLRRVASGLTLRAVMDATGIDMTLLSEYERGVRTPGPRNVRRIDQVLG